MGAPANLFDTATAVGIREDLTDLIHNITPTDTPFMTAIGSSSARQTKHEWQTDELATANGANAASEGADAALQAQTPTVRLDNFTQILVKIYGVSGTHEVVDKAGRDSELAYLAAKNGRELKRDMESALVDGSDVGSDTVAGKSGTDPRRLGSYLTWVATNDVGTPGTGDANRGTGGAAGGGGTAPTDGTPRALTQGMLDDVIGACWDSGGNPTQIHAGKIQKKNISQSFDAVGERRTDAGGTTIYATADVYVSNFGTLAVVPNRYIRKTNATGVDREILIVDPEYWKLSTLRPWQSFELAKTGDNERRQMLVEATLEACNEASSGIVADLN